LRGDEEFEKKREKGPFTAVNFARQVFWGQEGQGFQKGSGRERPFPIRGAELREQRTCRGADWGREAKGSFNRGMSGQTEGIRVSGCLAMSCGKAWWVAKGGTLELRMCESTREALLDASDAWC